MKEYEYNIQAMGTACSISIVSSDKQDADAKANHAIKSIQNYELTFSRFLQESELSLLNQKKHMAVSREFIRVLDAAYTLYLITDGVFNPLVQIERLGYVTSFPMKEGSISIDSAEPYDIDFSLAVIDRKHSTVTLNPGQKLDFGGFLKGYLAEKLCTEIYTSSADIQGVIVNMGGDLHTKGLDENGERFVFTIDNPVDKTSPVTVPIYNQSLATSGTYKRTWQSGGKTVSHLLDTSGKKNPKTDIVSVSVIHNQGGYSEALTKVLLAAGSEHALALADKADCKAVIITNQGAVLTNIL